MKEEAIDILWMMVKNLEQMYFEMKSRSDARKVKSLYNDILKHLKRLENNND